MSCDNFINRILEGTKAVENNQVKLCETKKNVAKKLISVKYALVIYTMQLESVKLITTTY